MAGMGGLLFVFVWLTSVIGFMEVARWVGECVRSFVSRFVEEVCDES